MTKKLTIDYVRQEMKNKKWTVLSKDYNGSQSPLNVICPNGHNTTITWNNFQRGQGCKYCAGNVKYSLNEIKNKYKNKNLEYLEDHYKNNNQVAKFKCSCGKIDSMRIADVLHGSRCKYCKNKRISAKNRISKDKINNFCKNNGCILLDAWVENKRTRIKYYCSCGDPSPKEAYWTNFRRFPNCKKCGAKKVSKEKSYKWNSDREQIKLNKLFQKRCYNLISRCFKEIGQHKQDKKKDILGYSPIELKSHILNHPNYNPSWENWHIDHIFPIKAFLENGILDLSLINCLNNLQPLKGEENLLKGCSYKQKEFEKWLAGQNQIALNKFKKCQKKFNEWTSKHCKNIFPQLVDTTKENERKHLKTIYNRFLNEGKQPIFVTPFEWETKKEICKSCLLSKSGFFFKRVYARKCNLQEVPMDQFRQFCNDNHLQGGNRLGIYACVLKYNDQIIAGMSVGRHNRHRKELVLDRLCFKQGVQIIGGAGKLFSYILNWCKTNNYNKISSFSDNRWSDGGIYKKLGFNLENNIECDYFYVRTLDPISYISKQSQRKKAVSCPDDCTEKQWAKIRGLNQIWDCGKKKWEMLI